MLRELNQSPEQYPDQFPDHHPDQHKTREELLLELAQLRLELAQNQQTTLDRPLQRGLLQNSLLKGGFGLALLLLGSTGVASYFNIQKLTENRHLVEHTHQVLEFIDITSNSIKDAERGRRGYIITANNEFLETYRLGTQTTQETLPYLRELTSDNPEQQQRLDQLEPLIQQGFILLDHSIALKQQSPFEQANQIELTNQGRQLRQQIQTLLTTMKQEEQWLLAEQLQATDVSVRDTNWTIGISYILGFGLLAMIARLLNKEIRQRRQAENIICQTNANLETLIQDRTAELTQTNRLLQTEIQDRRQAETALIESEQYLRALVEAEPECVKVITADGTLLNMNAAGLAMIEADSLEQVQGQCVCPLIESAHQQAFLAFTQQVAQGRASILEFEIIGLKGTRRWLESHAVPLPDRNQDRVNVLAVTRDITDRKQAEAALKTSEERLRLALEGANLGMWDYDLVSGQVEWTDRCKAMFGLALDTQVIYDMFIHALHPDDRHQVDRAVTQSIADRTQYDIEYRAQWANGTARWIAAKGRAVYDETGQPIRMVGITLDINDRKQAELELQQAKAELEQRVQERTAELQQQADEIQDLYNNAPCGYHSLNAAGQFVRVNNTELRWLGYDRDELLGQSFAALLTPQSLQVFQENFQKFKQQGWVNNLEFELICKDGSILPVNLNATAIYDAAGNFLMSRSTLFDIRDRKQIEAALRDSEVKFRSLTESSPNGVLMTDAQGQIVYTNPRAQEICGYSFEEALGTGWMRFIHPDDLPLLQDQWETAIAQPQNMVLNEVRYVHKDSTVRYGCIKLAPLLDTNNQLTGYVGMIEDITEQRQIETMKNEFISIVSHELRTPLTAIRGSLGLLANGVYDRKPEKGQKMLALALTQTDRLVRLVSDILDLKRLESGQVTLIKQSCEAATLMTQSIEAMQDLAQQSKITLSVTPLYVPVWAAPDAITQTLTNLISNAIKFSPEGSTIWLRAELVEREWGGGDRSDEGDREPGFSLSSPSTQSVCFAVKDQGRGIPSDKVETIFGQFQQVDASDSRLKGGTGLGLAICRSIVQQHGGQIWVESVLGEGSTFYFTLPTTPDSGVFS